jgi:hypothetical protein
MKMCVKICALALIAAALVVPARAVQIHVSPKGNDLSGDGSIQRPIASPSRAVGILTSRTEATRKEAAEVIFHAGTYPLRGSLVIGPAQSGTERARVTFRAADNGEVRFSGAVAIAASAVHEITDAKALARLPTDRDTELRLYEIRLADLGLASFPPLKPRGFGRPWAPSWPELYQNGVPLQLSASTRVYRAAESQVPKHDPVSEADGKSPSAASPHPVACTVDAGCAAVWRAAMEKHGASPFLGGRWARVWADDFIGIAAISADGTITLQDRHHYGVSHKKSALRIYNLVEEMRHAGDYTLEPSQKRLLVLLPPEGAKNLFLTWSGEPQVVLKDTTFVHFEGLRFGDCRGDAVTIKGGSHLTFDHCDFDGIGETAMGTERVSHLTVRNCRFARIGACGVGLDGGDRATLAHADNVVDHCSFESFGRLYRTYAPGVLVRGVGSTVSHCLFHDAPHSAILFGGNEHLITKNEIHAVMTEAADCGAIYGGRDFACYGIVISGNWIHGVGGSQRSGIYLDDQLSGVTVTGNLVEGSVMGVLVGGGRYNTVENNILNCRQPIHMDSRGTSYGKKNMRGMLRELAKLPIGQEPWKSRYPQVRQGDMNKPTGTVVKDNPRSGPFEKPEVGPREKQSPSHPCPGGKPGGGDTV